MAAPSIPSQAAYAPLNVADLDSWLIGDGKFVFVLKMQPTDLAGGTATLYASTDTYRAQDSPPRLILPSIAISILNASFGLNAGEGQIDYNQFKSGTLAVGSFGLLNNDGLLDSWVTSYGWPGAECELQFGADGGTLYPFVTFRVHGDPEFDVDPQGSVITFSVKGSTVNPNGQIITDTFGGGTGLDGGDEHKGKTEPALIGKMDNVKPIYIDSSNNKLLIDPAGVDAVSAVYEGGLDDGGATTITIGDGSLTLAARPTYEITCDATGLARQGVADYTLAANFKTLADDFGGSTTPVTSGLSEDGGFYLAAGSNSRFEKYLQWSIRPAGIYWTAQDGSRLIAGELGDPDDGSSVRTFTDKDIRGISRQPTAPPAWQVRVGYRPLGSMLGSSYAVEDLDEISRLSQPNRFEVATDATVLTDYPDAIAVDALSSLYDKADATALAASMLAWMKIKRDIYRVTVVRHPLSSWIGQVVTLNLGRYGITAKKTMITGWDIDLNNRSFVMECWG